MLTGFKLRMDYTYRNDINLYPKIYYAFTFKLPTLPAGEVFTKAYLGLYMFFSGSLGGLSTIRKAKVYIKKRGYINRLATVYETPEMAGQGITAVIDSIPDFYTNEIDTNNEFFYVTKENDTNVNGYELFDLDVDVNTYNGIDEMSIIVEREHYYWDTGGSPISCYEEIQFNEVCLMLQKTSTIGDKIYV